MEDLLNPQLDRAALHARFVRDRQGQVLDVFRVDFAERLHDCLHTQVPWHLAYFDGRENVLVPPDRLKAMAPAERQALTKSVFDRARSQYQYAYNSYPMLTAYLEGWNPGHLLHSFFEYINGPEMLGLVREITGKPSLRRADAQAAFYGPGNFLRLHDDGTANHGQVAYVINLSKNWDPDWGGLLQFFDAEGNVERALSPRFNALNLFEVPRAHGVSFVAPFAGAPRYTIVGWFRDD